MYDIRPLVREDLATLRADSLDHSWTFIDDSMVKGPAFVATKDNRVFAGGGIVPLWGHVGEVWVAVTSEAKRHTFYIYRAAKNVLHYWQVMFGFNRFQAHIHEDHWKAIRFIQALDFNCDGQLRKYGPHGENYLLYSKVL